MAVLYRQAAACLLLLLPFVTFSQAVTTDTSAKLKVIGNKAYLSSVKANPDNQLVEIKKAIPNITLDIRYATSNNFMKQVMYKQARAFARKPVVARLKQIQAALNVKGYGLKIYDAYRPYAITVAFYKKATNKAYVASPKKGSKHNRGCAVDLTLIDLKTGKDLEMPTPYDSFQPQASPTFSALPPAALKNRNFLIATMHKYGFKVIHNEWWHFDFNGWNRYDIMDIPFEKL
ncbi:MAG TPA: M15 family metallopeptidase [Pedobacter sp.]|nr:M15 family metallopeptidase [Pedobacter sp.]